MWLPIFTLGPGDEEEFTIELDLNKPGMTKDWAFTAWGEDGPLQVFIRNKPSDDQWYFIDRDDSLLPDDEFEVGNPAQFNAVANEHATTAETSAT